MGSLPASQRELAAAEINRFIRKVGPDRLIGSLTKLEVERHQQTLIDSGEDTSTRLEPLKSFLLDLKARKLTEVNLGAGVRVRRRGGRTGGGKHEQAPVVELTQEGHDELQHELTRLETEEMPRLLEDLTRAREDGDLRENAPYHEAKRQMGVIQGKIDSLRNQLKASQIVARQAGTERIGLGSKVVLRDLQYEEEVEYTVVGPGEVDTRKGRISIQSPVGSAVKDAQVGDVVEVSIPSGTARYRVERIESANGS